MAACGLAVGLLYAGGAPKSANAQGVDSVAATVQSQTELEEARQRYIRLRSRVIALKNNLADLRRKLAQEGSSIRSDLIAAEQNMDAYMVEADNALRSGDAHNAQENMNRAEGEAKKIAAAIGG